MYFFQSFAGLDTAGASVSTGSILFVGTARTECTRSTKQRTYSQ